MFCVLKIVVFNLVGNVKRDKKKKVISTLIIRGN